MLKVWDCESGAFDRSLKGHTSTVNDACFNAKGTVLASCSADMSVKLWDFEQSFECTRTLRGHEHNVCGICWVHSEDLIVSASRDSSLRIWEVSHPTSIHSSLCRSRGSQFTRRIV
jgi:platelet-activating factor acetylhydrolase IB subunit alpha